jgi:magnesium transporter
VISTAQTGTKIERGAMTDDLKNLHERIADALESKDDSRLRSLLTDARPADLAEIFDLLESEARTHILFDILPPSMAAEVVIELDEAVRGDVVEELEPQEVADLASEMDPDDAADMIGELTLEVSEEILEKMPDEVSAPIEELLGYPEESAGGIMTTEVVKAPSTATVRDATRLVREALAPEDVHEVYLVDEEDRLAGVVPLRRLVTNLRETPLKDICNPDPVFVYANEDQETVLNIIRKYDVPEAAVVDENERLIGIITYDDLLDVAEEEAEEDLLRMAGTDPAERETSSPFRAARIRLSWLLPCMLGMLITAAVIMLAEPQFEVAIFGALVPFVPMIGAMGGNTGIQTSTIVVRGFATGELAGTKLGRALYREGRIALLMAPACGLLAWGMVHVSLPLLRAMEQTNPGLVDPVRIAWAVGIAMCAAIFVAALLGIALPFIFKSLKVDPAIASGPIVTTMNDVVSVSIYLSIGMIVAQ